jgi:hypothetical protein
MVLRVCKRKHWIPAGACDLFSKIPRSLDDEGWCELNLFLQALLAFRQEESCLLWLKRVSNAFKDRGKKIRTMLGEFFKGTGDEIWAHEMLVFARIINKNWKSRDGLKILLAAYTGMNKLHFKDMYCADIVNGLKRDSSSWIEVLKKFMESGNPPKYRYSYNAFYGILKSLLQRLQTKDMKSSEYARSVSDLFTRILLISRKVSVEDWKLVVKYTSLELISNLVVDVSEIGLDKASRQKLVVDLLTKQELTAQTCAAVVKLLESSNEPNDLILNILTVFDKQSDIKNMRIFKSSCFWHLFKSLVQNGQAPEVQLTLFRYIDTILNRQRLLFSRECCDYSGLKDSIVLIISGKVSANYHEITRMSISRAYITHQK